MSLIKCSECGQEISDKASMCVKCGCPVTDTAKASGNLNPLWDAVTKARTPINVFALAMMACAAVLGYSATKVSGCDARTAFTYTIHAFLAVSGMFFSAILFCRKGIYHPEELGKARREVLDDLGKDRPVIAAMIIILMLAGYAFYQYKNPNPCSPDMSQRCKQVQAAPKSDAPD